MNDLLAILGVLVVLFGSLFMWALANWDAEFMARTGRRLRWDDLCSNSGEHKDRYERNIQTKSLGEW